MCGLVGIFNSTSDEKVDANLLGIMNESQFHRGPDECGLHAEESIGLGHRRLAIIDLSSGQQPLFNEDNTVVVVYNGEIYNFKQLMSSLISLGHRFRTKCDTEVIVHAWEEWGEKCVEKFRGMFAFSIWDRNTKTLFLARDRLGIKPLYYSYLPSGELIFSSELKALVLHPRFGKIIDPLAVEDYFSFGYVPEPKTIYKNAYKLCPGQTLTMRYGQKKFLLNTYWDVSFETEYGRNESDLVDEFVARFKEAVSIRMISEVPIGAFLSGGVDSSAVVAMMAESSSDRINTCSIGFSENAYDETEYANQVAKRYNCHHFSKVVDIGDFDLLDSLDSMFDEPYADSSAIPTFRVCELAKKKVTVVLSGDGGDENLAGYGRYQSHLTEEKLRSYLPVGLRRRLFSRLGAIYPHLYSAPRIFRAKSTFQSLARSSIQGYFHEISVIRGSLRKKMFSKGFNRELNGYTALEVFNGHAKRSPTADPLSIIQYLDFKTYLVGDILTKVDRTSMANSLEVRVPLLDHEFVEWMSRLPTNSKLNNGMGKKILKTAMEPKLSNDILYRRKKGFAVPVAEWFRGPLKERVRKVVSGERLLDTGMFDQATLKKMFDDHVCNRRDNSPALWSLLMYDSFQKKIS